MPERGLHGGVLWMICWEIWGSVQFPVEQVGAHSSEMIVAVLGHFWARVGEHVDRLHHSIPRAHWEDSGCATFVQLVEFTHFPMISSEHGVAQVTKTSSGDMFRVHEQPKVIASDWDKLPSLIFMIEYGSGFADRDFTWRPM
jgi:hypothetical protein